MSVEVQAAAAQTATTQVTEAKVTEQSAAPAQAAAAAPAQSVSNAAESQKAAGGESQSLPEQGAQDPGKDSKPTEAKAADGTAQKPEQQKSGPEVVYDFKLPEGMKTDPKALDDFKSFAKELNLSPEQAQKLIDRQATLQKGQEAALDQAVEDAEKALKAETIENWKKETLQTLGANPDRELAFAHKASERLASPELRQFLLDSGLLHNRLFVQHFIKLGRSISEDSLVERNGANSGGADRSAAEVLYGTHNQASA
jgi:hypothetical protein